MAMRKGLGKGLGALIGDYNEQPDAPSEGAVTLPLQKIEPNPLQPRKTFNPEELDSFDEMVMKCYEADRAEEEAFLAKVNAKERDGESE